MSIQFIDTRTVSAGVHLAHAGMDPFALFLIGGALLMIGVFVAFIVGDDTDVKDTAEEQ